MTTTFTLTERYISATIRSLRPDAQADVRAELEASIADAIEARVEQGEAPESVERAVLTELGDPGILAAGYADRPLYLIGPRFYLTWWRLLKLLLIIVPVCVLGGVALGQTISNAPVGEIISTSILATGGAILHICFWTTLVFVILERSNSTTAIEKWDLDQLPEPTEKGVGRSELIASLVFLGIAIGSLLWDRFRGFVHVDGGALPILNPQLWPWGIGVLLLLIVAEAVFAVVLYRRGRWSTGLAVVNTVLAVAFLAWVLVLLLTGDLVNPEFLAQITAAGGEEFASGQAESADEGGVFRILAVLLGFGIAVGVGWDIVDGWMKTWRARRGREE
ncbi:permease prefix domain 1-containing protein [Microbacterium sp.]|uniref:permease prefix domain 1-containing protein n=1 Tax=Microbacterium sp. TaxID=51671 RepID=UPI00261E5F1D|nr:permease prefix domain 1-containing protein [Microbacterium sp.]MCV0336431.1 permease prefix domain 1-containing protein [Microbacterium sp.]MCV0376070.1 permease prefix domain 1-containing protein [Microbacterium sp.]MCV0390326.1 permease prefix domain 1-containing protein [Microbacterium sp.]MCV0418061.1 permease prefix domain 1-containing protein [Microbacterium sp.]MCV0422271.1 permease prefix domain 1-containing protein [Microbacterium sp.]